MKNIYNIILSLPLVGLSSIYIYTLLTILTSKTVQFYLSDPKNSPISIIYEPFLYLIVIGWFSIFVGVIIMLIDYIKFKGNLTSVLSKWIYFIGVALTIFLHYTDLGYCQIWFFD